eukprot:109182_1
MSAPPEKQLLYKLIIRQLLDDNLNDVAKRLSTVTGVAVDRQLKRDSLSNIISNPIQQPKHEPSVSSNGTLPSGGASGNVKSGEGSSVLDDDSGATDPFRSYQTKFITTHKDACRTAVFSRDGTLAATGSADCSIKLLDVSKMHFHSQAKATADYRNDMSQIKPVLRTFYDHLAPINDLDFHPTATLLASCSKDCSVKFFDHEKLQVKRSYKHVVEPESIRTINFHPGGDFLLTGGDNRFIRLFNCNTFQAFISRDLNKQHTKPINQLRYSRDGRMFASCSKDGAIKLWDGVTNLCVKTIMDAHSGEEVSSVAFSRDGSVLLSGGKDSASKIWDVASGRELTNFQGCKQSNYRLQTVFAPDENYVFSCDERTYNVVAWDRNSGDIVREFSGHNKVIHWVAVSPSEEAFLSCSGDFRARFWVADQL